MNDLEQLNKRVKFLENIVTQHILADKYVFKKNIQLADAVKIQCGRTQGTVIGTEGYVSVTDQGQKLGFYGKTPQVQQPAIAGPSGGATQDAEARIAINSIISFLTTIGLTR